MDYTASKAKSRLHLSSLYLVHDRLWGRFL